MTHMIFGTVANLRCEEAGALLGMSEGSFRRWKARFDEEGEAGLIDKRGVLPSNRKAQDWESRLVIKLYADKYRGFNIKHYHLFLVEEHGLNRSYSFVKRTLEDAKLITKSKRGGDHPVCAKTGCSFLQFPL